MATNTRKPVSPKTRAARSAAATPASPTVAPPAKPDVAAKAAPEAEAAKPAVVPAPAVVAAPVAAKAPAAKIPAMRKPRAKAAPKPTVKPPAAVVPLKPVDVAPAPVKLALVPAAAPAARRPEPASVAAGIFGGYEDFAAFGKEYFDALTQANTAFAKGVEDFSKEVIGLTQASLENVAGLAGAMFSAKSMQEVVDLQVKLTRANFDRLVADSAKLSDLGMKVTRDALAPVNARLNAAVEKMLSLAAA